MPTDYITIPRKDYRSLLDDLKRGVAVCREVSDLRIALNTLKDRLEAHGDRAAVGQLAHAIEACEDVSQLRIDFLVLERRLREFDQELTPIRPPSRTDIKAAFDNSVDFATGKKKPPAGE